MEKEKGFTLIEVVAALVIISIVLLSFVQIFVQTNKVANLNNEKLVVINLADAVLAKLKSQKVTKQSNLSQYFNDTTETDKKKKNPPLEIDLNGKTYTVTYTPSQQKKGSVKYQNTYNTEEDLNLVKVVVTVISPNGKTKGSSEGYVSIE